MGLINLVLKAFILVLDLRDTYNALDSAKLDEIGRNERQVLVRNADDGTKQITTRRRVGTSKRKAAVKSALTTVLVWNLFHKVEPLCDRTIAWFVPFYDSFKTLFLIWMLFTRSYGAAILVHRFLAPMIRPYESIIEGTYDITLTLVGWVAALLAPVLDKLAPLLQSASSIAGISQHSTAAHSEPIADPAPSAATASRSQPAARISTTEKARKKPPPPPDSPSGSIKASPASALPKANAFMEPQPRLSATKARQALAKKASQGNLSAARRVLQELPVPRHAFESNPASSVNAPPAPSTTKNKLPPSATAPNVSTSRNGAPVVKAEPSEPTLGRPSVVPSDPPATVPPPSTTAPDLGPPPTPPTGLRNYAFIPGMTPQRAGPSTLISPTPRFPGGFSFSFAAPQASTSTSTNPFQSQARIPATTQMAPLSFSSQIQAPGRASSMPGINSLGISNVMTHENVPAAQDDRIVPPPNGTATIRKPSSSRSLKSTTASDSKRAAAKTATGSTGQKRSRPEEDTEGSVDAEGRSTAAATSPRKRPKSALSNAATGKTTSASASAKPRAKVKATGVNGQAATTAEKAAARRKAAENGVQRTAKKTTAPKTSSRNTEESMTLSATGDKTKSKAASSPRKKAASTASKAATASAKPSTQRTAAKKSSSANASRSVSVEASEASEPPQRLTRSRTKQNLAG